MKPLINRTSSRVALPLCLNQEDRFLLRETFLVRGMVLPSANVIEGFRLTGSVEYQTLVKVLMEIVRRHTGLRVKISANMDLPRERRDRALSLFGRTAILTPGAYVQSITDASSFELSHRDLSSLSPSEQVSEVENTFQSESTKGFDYSRPPLLRATLLRVTPTEHVLIIAIDHHVSDGWSMKVVAQEVDNLYAYFSGHASEKPPAPPIGFPDFAVWQAEAFRVGYFDESLVYWANQWAEYAPSRISHSELPSTLVSTRRDISSFGFESSVFDADLTKKIRQLAREAKVTVHAIFVAASTILLKCLTGRDKIAIWGYFYNRSQPEVQNMVGYLVTRHLLGFDLSGDPSIAEVLKRIRSVILEGVVHEAMPIEYLWTKLKCHPRFEDTRFVVDYRKFAHLAKDHSASSPVAISRTNLASRAGGRADWGILVEDHEVELCAKLRYAAGLFSETGMRHIMLELETLIGQIITTPNARLSELTVGVLSVGSRQSSPQMSEFILADSDLLSVVAHARTRS